MPVTDTVDREDVAGVGHGDENPVLAHLDRQREVLFGDRLGDLAKRLGVHLVAVEGGLAAPGLTAWSLQRLGAIVGMGFVTGFRELVFGWALGGPGEILGGGEFKAQKRLDQRGAVLLGVLLGLIELLGGDQSHRHKVAGERLIAVGSHRRSSFCALAAIGVCGRRRGGPRGRPRLNPRGRVVVIFAQTRGVSSARPKHRRRSSASSRCAVDGCERRFPAGRGAERRLLAPVALSPERREPRSRLCRCRPEVGGARARRGLRGSGRYDDAPSGLSPDCPPQPGTLPTVDARS